MPSPGYLISPGSPEPTFYRFYVDPSVRRVGKPRKGDKLAPDGHRRRCQAHNRYRLQCGRFSSRGSNFCRIHGGWFRKDAGRRLVRYRSRMAGTHLAQVLEDIAASGDRASLSDEVDLSRVLCARAVETMAAAMDLEHSATPDADLMARAASLLRSSLDHVADMVVRMERARALSKATVSVQDITEVMAQVCSAVDITLHDYPELSDRLIAAIRLIRVPEKTSVVIA